MPAEWAPHERTLMAWPCRRELWGGLLGAAKEQYAGVANAVAAFEPLTMVVQSAADAAEAGAALTGEVEIVELPIDDSWLRDSGPMFVTGPGGERAGVHFGFNSWGEKFTPYDRDAAVGGLLVDHVGDRRYTAPFVLEGGSICVDGEGTLITTEECLLHPSRNPGLSREEIEQGLRDYLGVETVVWLGQGPRRGPRHRRPRRPDRRLHRGPARCCCSPSRPARPTGSAWPRTASALRAAGLEVVDFPPLAYTEVDGDEIAASYLNFYLCNGGVVVPVAGDAADADALQRIAAAYPDREVVGVRGEVIAAGGGGPHCITQQVPRASA